MIITIHKYHNSSHEKTVALVSTIRLFAKKTSYLTEKNNLKWQKNYVKGTKNKENSHSRNKN